MNDAKPQIIHGNSIPEIQFESGTFIKPGFRVRVNSRHGTTGTGTVKDIRVWQNCPPTIVLEMDADTNWSQRSQAGWPLDDVRFPTLGVFGGEIADVLTLN